MNHEALAYYEKLANVKKINFSNWRLFFRLYKYEEFSYKMKNFLILNMPTIARIAFKHIKKEEQKNKKWKVFNKWVKIKRIGKQ